MELDLQLNLLDTNHIYIYLPIERMGVEYQRFDGKEYVSLRRYYNLLCKYKALKKENKNLKEKLETLELWLDRKEKLNEKYRKELKSTYVYDAKQVRDIC